MNTTDIEGPKLHPWCIDAVVRIAQITHEDQKDKGGQPYILHVLRVGLAGQTDEERIVGFLHDVLEDGNDLYPEESLRKYYPFPEHVMDAVVALTRQKGESYGAYLARVKANPLARKVKLNDLLDNMSYHRRENIPAELRNRYNRAHCFLTGVHEEFKDE